MSTGVHAVTRPMLSIATIGVDKYSVAAIRDAVSKLPAFEVAAELPPVEGESATGYLAEYLQPRKFDIYIIDFDADRQNAGATAELIRTKIPGANVFAVSSNADPDLIIQAMHDGCTEYLTLPLAKDRIVQALVRLEHKRRDAAPASKEGGIYVLLGAKGGTGVTTLATHLAAYTAREGPKTLLIDQHPDLGDVSVYFSLGEHRYHFYELVNNIHRLDAQLLEGFLLHHSCGLDILPSPESFGVMVQSLPTALHHTLAFLREVYDVIIVDCAPGLNGANVACIEEADSVYLIATPELAPIRNMARCLDHLKRYNCPDGKIQVVINRYSKKAAITQQQIERAIQRKVSLTIPNSYPDVIGAIHSGQPMPFESRSDLVQALRRWSGSLSETAKHHTAVTGTNKRRLGILGL